ncbi:energy transducer TonB [Frateuria sp. Soil773]|uniref:M56 family metallopeptidase n=1 Tax=Frateuria sp. Soil773 TaxID=1736407 RepID=UPI0006FB9CB2|nr:TonB family protein [Frateuria sp. Soil773]KRE89599.1 energy transducer TonB [Frateuria sp. Soil773]
MDAGLLRTLTMVTLGLSLVLLARRPARRLFGAGPAFTLWLLPPLMALLSWLPAPVPALVQAVHVLPAAAALPGSAAAPAPSAGWLPALWLAGAGVLVLRLAIQYARLLLGTCPLQAPLRRTLPPLPGLRRHRLREHAAGPAVLWAPRPLLLLPPDFHRRFDAAQRELVLRHELSHLRRGDPLWRLLAELLFALLWFHPLAWLALSRFRLDQELACDEHVLRAMPEAESRYARTLLHGTGTEALPALIPWLAEPQLKERLTMIQRHRPGSLRRHSGLVLLGALMAGSVLVAQAGTSARTAAASQDLGYNLRTPPLYPADAVKNREQGMVLLDVLVGTDGKPRRIEVEPRQTTASASLVKAATDAAAQWRFNPALRQGRAVEGHVRVPVDFRLDPLSEPAANTPKSSSSS